jgi:signal transduction histidine kinase/CheY-like chemotaxis protein
VGSFFLRKLPLSWRSLLLLLGLSAAFVPGYLPSLSQDWLYFQALIVIAAGTLVGSCALIVLSLSLTAIPLGCYLVAPASYSALHLLPPLGLLWAAALASWLSSQSLYASLNWALDSQARAWKTAEEVRLRRGELRRTLDSLRVTHGLLERTIRELEAARLEAEEARRIKSRFVANISHEFRTPLNIIVGFAEMLCTSPDTYGSISWPPALREDVLTIWRNAEHLLKMIDDVLDLAQIEASRLPVLPEPVDLVRLIRESLATASALLRDSGIGLRISLPEALPLLGVDPTRIRQVLLNLVNNAVRFTPQGYVEVGAYLTKGEVIVYVRDTGEGIPQDRLESVFEEFEQVDTSGRRRHRGLGLGLAISRHLIHLHGGRIWAESEAGKGSTFYFSLPCLEKGRKPIPAQFSRGRPRATRPSSEKEAVVVLCSDPLVLRMLARHLGKLRVITSDSVDEAIALVHEHHPVAVLIAAESRGGSQPALDMARAVREGVAPSDVPTIVCDFPTERQAGQSLGVSECMLKPVTQKELVPVINRLHASPRRILVVDDDLDMLRLLSRMVEQGWPKAQVLTAASGADALRLASQLPDVILLDLLMPGMSGVEVLNALRADPVVASIPIVVITARAPAEELVTVREGEVRVLRKRGFAAGELVHIVESLGMSLPPHYGITRADSPGTRGAVPA